MKKPNLPKPEPMELATLAAILCPNTKPGVAMKRAMAFYIEASFFVSELPKSFDALIAYASEERNREYCIMTPLRAALEEARADTLKLDPQAHSDPAREFLVAKGFNLKTARGVLEKLRQLGPAAEHELPKYRREESGRSVYYIPRSRLLNIISDKKKRRAASKRTSARKAAKSHAQKTVKQKVSKSSVRHVC
jgi:hypothetical protein